MKKITIIFSLFITFTGTVCAQERVQYDKAASAKYKDGEQSIQIYLSGELVLLSEEYDTTIEYKGGRPIETIKDNSKTLIVKYKEMGKVSSWVGDTCYVTFDTKNSEAFTLPFKPAASGAGNTNNLLKLALDQKCTFGLGGVKKCEEIKQITLQEKKYKVVSGVGSYLEYEPKLKSKEKKKKIVSRGHKVK